MTRVLPIMPLTIALLALLLSGCPSALTELREAWAASHDFDAVSAKLGALPVMDQMAFGAEITEEFLRDAKLSIRLDPWTPEAFIEVFGAIPPLVAAGQAWIVDFTLTVDGGELRRIAKWQVATAHRRGHWTEGDCSYVAAGLEPLRTRLTCAEWLASPRYSETCASEFKTRRTGTPSWIAIPLKLLSGGLISPKPRGGSSREVRHCTDNAGLPSTALAKGAGVLLDHLKYAEKDADGISESRTVFFEKREWDLEPDPAHPRVLRIKFVFDSARNATLAYATAELAIPQDGTYIDALFAMAEEGPIPIHLKMDPR